MSEQLSEQELIEGERVCEAARKGPWKAAPMDDSLLLTVWAPIGEVGEDGSPLYEPIVDDVFEYAEDAEFTALACTLLPRALAEVRRLQEQEKRLCMLTAYLAGLADMAPYIDWRRVRLAMGVPIGQLSLTVQDYAKRGRALMEQQKEAGE